MKEFLILVGGGGHCKSCIDVIESEAKYRIKGIVDLKQKLGENVLGYEIFATDEELPKLVKEYRNFLVTIGQIKQPLLRVSKFEQLMKYGVEMPFIVSPSAKVCKQAKILAGSIVMHGAMVGSDAIIGRNCIVNTGAVVEHDTIIGDSVHVSTGSIINGQCKIGDRTFLVSGSIISNGINICSNVVVGAGAVVMEDIISSGTYVGIPARKVR